MTTHHILNLGAGVQSTALYLMFCERMILGEDGLPVELRAAIFADTQDESRATYKHLDWLRSLGGPEIMVRTIGKLGDDLVRGVNSRNRRFSSIPAFTVGDDGRAAIGRPQCTADYKVAVVERCIRREIMGLAPRQRVPADIRCVQYFGLSYEEMRRVLRVSHRFMEIKWSTPKFPLVERGMTREKCVEWMAGRVPHPVPRSACVFCPYHNNAEWRRIRDEDPAGWKRAVEVDRAIRDKTSVCTRGMRAEQFLHRSLVPLDQADLSDPPKPLYEDGWLRFGDGVEGSACAGMCGV